MTDAIRKALDAFESACKCWHTGDEAEANAAVSRACGELKRAIASQQFPYDRTFAAIAAATSTGGAAAINVSVKAFIEAWNAYPTHGVMGTQDSEAVVLAVAGHIDGWKSATFGWQHDPDPVIAEKNKAAAIQEHAAECIRRIRSTLAAGVAPTLPVNDTGITDSRCNYLAHAGHICNKCGRIHDGGGSPWPGIIEPDGVKEPLLPCGLCGTKPGPEDQVFCPNEECGAVLVTQSEADEHARGVTGTDASATPCKVHHLVACVQCAAGVGGTDAK